MGWDYKKTLGIAATPGIAISAASTFGGDIMNNQSAKSAAKKQFERQLYLQNEQNKQNIENYKHRYQWAKEDMEKSGINPVLGLANGAGAVAGAGMGSANSANTAAADWGNITHSASELSKTMAEVENIDSQTNVNAQETLKKASENKYISAEKESTLANMAADTALKEEQKKSAAAEVKKKVIEKQLIEAGITKTKGSAEYIAGKLVEGGENAGRAVKKALNKPNMRKKRPDSLFGTSAKSLKLKGFGN